jgi:hypothetical protein
MTSPPEKRRLPFAKRFLRRKNDCSNLQSDFSNGAVAGRTGWLERAHVPAPFCRANLFDRARAGFNLRAWIIHPVS